MNKNLMKYSKELAKAETTSRRQHKFIIDKRTEEEIKIIKIEQLTRSIFDLSGAYPFVFDALAYICTHHQAIIERKNIPQETHYRVIVPIRHFQDFAIDKYKELRNKMMTELYELAKEPKAKILPLDLNHSILTVPIRVDLIHKDGSEIPAPFLKIYQNLNGELPIKAVVIEFYKPLFRSLLEGEHGIRWFPLPKSFHAKLLDVIKRCRDLPEFQDPEFQKEELKANANTYRKIYMYMNLHDNGKSERLTFNAVDMMLSCYPEMVKIKNDKKYLDWWNSRLFIKKACILFNIMGQEGLLDGVKFVPTGIQYYKPSEQFKIRVVRSIDRQYKQIEPFKEF